MVKHLFNVEGLVFLFSVDMEQLGCVIRGIYGESLDARNYLNRLFQYVTHLPEPNIQKYIELLFDEKKENFKEVHQMDEHKKFLVQILTELVNGFQLSLRELDTIWKNYLVLYDYKLKEYVLTDAHLCYLLFLIMKYKYADFEETMEKSNSETLGSMRELRKCKSLLEWESPFKYLLEVNQRLPLREVCGMLQGTKEPWINGTNIKIADADEATISFFPRDDLCDTIQFTPTTSFAGVLFAPDFASWGLIKDQNILRYMKDQLELITFDGEQG